MSFMDDYESVATRLEKWWASYPNGQVHTELVEHGDGLWIFYAAVYCDVDDLVPRATGYAQERETQKGVNSTSALENCETSAIGRALANAGFASKARASQEEMRKTQSVPEGFESNEHAHLVYDALKERVKAIPEDDTSFADWRKAHKVEWPWNAAWCADANAFLDAMDEVF